MKRPGTRISKRRTPIVTLRDRPVGENCIDSHDFLVLIYSQSHFTGIEYHTTQSRSIF